MIALSHVVFREAVPRPGNLSETVSSLQVRTPGRDNHVERMHYDAELGAIVVPGGYRYPREVVKCWIEAEPKPWQEQFEEAYPDLMVKARASLKAEQLIHDIGSRLAECAHETIEAPPVEDFERAVREADATLDALAVAPQPPVKPLPWKAVEDVATVEPVIVKGPATLALENAALAAEPKAMGGPIDAAIIDGEWVKRHGVGPTKDEREEQPQRRNRKARRAARSGGGS